MSTEMTAQPTSRAAQAGATPVPATPNQPAALNRSLLTLIGLILVLAGLAVVVLGLGLLADRTPLALPSPNDTVLPPALSLAAWTPYPVIVVAALVGLGCVRWLIAQTSRRPASRTWRLPTDAAQGRTEIDASAAAAAFVAEVQAYPDVAKAAAYITGTRGAPALHLDLTTTDQAPIGELRDRLDTVALPRLRQALELTSLPAEVLIRLGTQPTGRPR